MKKKENRNLQIILIFKQDKQYTIVINRQEEQNH